MKAIAPFAFLGVLAILFGGQAFAQQAPPSVMTVTLLGTGTPLPLADRFGPSTLVEAGGHKLLFDCGRGCSIRLFEMGVTLRDAKLFLTHLHSDHTVGIPDLWLTGWLPTLHPGDLTNKPLSVAGPKGVTHMMAHLKEAFAADLQLRPALPPLLFDSREIDPGVVYQHEGVTITAFDVDHGERAKPAYGYRVDYGGRSVVISGDTRFSENTIKYATGADVLIHEVGMVKDPALAKLPIALIILSGHTSPQDAGRIFARAKPRLAVYTHYIVAGQVGANSPALTDFVTATRETYDGPLEAGEDLMSIRIGDTISVTRRDRK